MDRAHGDNLIRYFDPVAGQHRRYQVPRETMSSGLRDAFLRMTMGVTVQPAVAPEHFYESSELHLAWMISDAVFHLDRMIWQMEASLDQKRSPLVARRSLFSSAGTLVVLQPMEFMGTKLEPFVTCRNQHNWGLGIRAPIEFSSRNKFQVVSGGVENDAVCNGYLEIGRTHRAVADAVLSEISCRTLLPFLKALNPHDDVRVAYDGEHLMIYVQLTKAFFAAGLPGLLRVMLQRFLLLRGVWQAVLYREHQVAHKVERFRSAVGSRSDLSYLPQRGHTARDWANAEFALRNPLWLSSEDLLTQETPFGEIQLSEIRMADVDKYFDGIFVTIPNLKATNVAGGLYVRGEGNSFFLDERVCVTRGWTEGEVELRQFNERYLTYAKNDVDLHYLLPTSLQHGLIQLYNWCRSPIFVTFQKGRTNIFIATPLDFLDPPYERRTQQDIQQFFENDLEALLKVMGFVAVGGV